MWEGGNVRRWGGVKVEKLGRWEGEERGGRKVGRWEGGKVGRWGGEGS